MLKRSLWFAEHNNCVACQGQYASGGHSQTGLAILFWQRLRDSPWLQGGWGAERSSRHLAGIADWRRPILPSICPLILNVVSTNSNNLCSAFWDVLPSSS